MIAIDLSKQLAPDPGPKAVQQINFTGTLENNATSFFIIKESKETIFDFLQGTFKAL